MIALEPCSAARAGKRTGDAGHIATRRRPSAVALLSSERPAFLTGNSWEPESFCDLGPDQGRGDSGSVRDRKHATWREWTTRWINHYPIRRAKWLVGSRQSALPRTNVIRSQWRAGGLPPGRPSFIAPREHVIGKAEVSSSTRPGGSCISPTTLIDRTGAGMGALASSGNGGWSEFDPSLEAASGSAEVRTERCLAIGRCDRAACRRG